MRPRAVVTAILLSFVGLSVVYLLITESRQERTPSDAHPARRTSVETARRATDDGHKMIVYYFHGTKRCHTCRTIEAYTDEAIRTGFGEKLNTGEVEWRSVNVDEPENEHFIHDYQLSTRSVVLVEILGGAEKRWHKLDRVWQLARNKRAFLDYVQENALNFLAGKDG